MAKFSTVFIPLWKIIFYLITVGYGVRATIIIIMINEQIKLLNKNSKYPFKI